MKENIISKRYAIALYEVAKENNKLETLINEYASFINSCKENNDFLQFIMNPLISKDDKVAVFNRLKDKFISESLYAFLVLLAKKNRLSILFDIYDVLKALYMDEKGEVEAEVSLATEISDNDLKELQSVLSKVTGKNVTMNITLDSSILGGLIAKVGSDLFDASIKGQLNKFKEDIIR